MSDKHDHGCAMFHWTGRRTALAAAFSDHSMQDTHDKNLTGDTARSELHHLEILFARATLRTSPVHGNVVPARSRSNSFVGQACGFVVHKAADEAHVCLVRLGIGVSHGLREGLRIQSNSNRLLSSR